MQYSVLDVIHTTPFMQFYCINIQKKECIRVYNYVNPINMNIVQ